MGYDKQKIKQIKEIILYIAALLLALKYSDICFGMIALLFRIFKPFIYGAVIAFILNLPLCFIERRLLQNWNTKLAKSIKRPLGILLSILFVVCLILIVVFTVVPQLGQTLVEIGNKIPVFAASAMNQLESVSKEFPELEAYLTEFETSDFDLNSTLEKLIQFLKTGMTSFLSSTVTVAGSIIGGVTNLFIGIIFALYILSQKETLCRQSQKVLSAFCSPTVKNRILNVCSIAYRNFSNFISGQCTEAVILGLMFTVSMAIFRLPYALLVGVLIAFSALIPIVGAFIGCFVGTFLILVNNPIQALGFIVLFFVLQQLEGNLIYPKVVGNKVGLPSIWVLMAVSIGGSLFGVAGMLFFIPLVSTFYAILTDYVNEKLKTKQPASPPKAESTDKQEVRKR